QRHRPPDRGVQERPGPSEREPRGGRAECILQRTRRESRQKRQRERDQRTPPDVAGERTEKALRPGSRRQGEERQQRNPLAGEGSEHRERAGPGAEPYPEQRASLLARADLADGARVPQGEPGPEHGEREPPQSPPERRLAHRGRGVDQTG